LKLSDVIIAIFTIVLAVKTAGLFRETAGLREATDKLWDAGERQMKLIAENAATQSREMQASLAATRDAVALAHPPRVLIKNVAIWRPDKSRIKTFIPGENIKGEAWVVNLGHETVTIHKIGVGHIGVLASCR